MDTAELRRDSGAGAGVIVAPAAAAREYVYRWGNNEKRATMKARRCVIAARGTMNSCMIQFVDNGQREVVSRNALRRAD